MLGFVLDVVFTVVAIRAVWRLLQGIMNGMSGGADESRRSRRQTAPGPPAHGVQMAKDPVCGTYVVPERALSVNVGRDTLYFCSAACRDKFRAKTA